MSDPLYRIMELLDAEGVEGRSPVAQVENLLAENRRLDRELHALARETDYGRLRKSLDAEPSDVLHLLHDHCLDEGRADEAAGWGWLAIRRKWPSRATRGWCWHGVGRDERQGHSEQLPLPLVQAAGAEGTGYPTAGLALEAVARAIALGLWRPK